MKNADKVKLLDQILALLNDNNEHTESSLKLIGTLTKAQGINGFKKCDIGSPVFELGDRYIIVMETLDGKSSSNIPYYKETLTPVINFENKAI